MGVKAGVEPLALWEAIRQGAGGRRRTFDRLADNFLQDKFDPPSFALRAGAQGREAGDGAGARGRRADAHRQPGARGADGGDEPRLGRRDSRVAMLLQKERAGVEIEVPAADIEAVHKRG